LALPSALENMAWMVLVLAVGVLALVAVRRCLARGDELLAMVVIAAATLLASPVSWSAHWVWIGPAFVLFTHRVFISRSLRAWIALAGAVIIFAIGPHTLLPQDHSAELHWTWWQHLVGDSYVLCGLGLLVVVAFRRRPVSQPPAAPVLAPASEPELAGTLAED
jgi:alpha-1,2-mannosyltransferase